MKTSTYISLMSVVFTLLILTIILLIALPFRDRYMFDRGVDRTLEVIEALQRAGQPGAAKNDIKRLANELEASR